MEEPILKIENLKKAYDGQMVLNGIDLQVRQGEVIVIVGPSGCGKSTLLRWVAKFAVFNAGTVLMYLVLFALLGPAILNELLEDGTGMLVLLLAMGNFSFWLCDRALASLTRYYHAALQPKLKKKFF